MVRILPFQGRGRCSIHRRCNLEIFFFFDLCNLGIIPVSSTFDPSFFHFDFMTVRRPFSCLEKRNREVLCVDGNEDAELLQDYSQRE